MNFVDSVRGDVNCVSVTRMDCSLVTGNQKTRTHSNVYCHVANLAPFAGGHHKMENLMVKLNFY